MGKSGSFLFQRPLFEFLSGSPEESTERSGELSPIRFLKRFARLFPAPGISTKRDAKRRGNSRIRFSWRTLPFTISVMQPQAASSKKA